MSSRKKEIFFSKSNHLISWIIFILFFCQNWKKKKVFVKFSFSAPPLITASPSSPREVQPGGVGRSQEADVGRDHGGDQRSGGEPAGGGSPHTRPPVSRLGSRVLVSPQVRQIMKKWADLKCDGKRRITAMRGPNGNNLRKKNMGAVERMVHKILMLTPETGEQRGRGRRAFIYLPLPGLPQIPSVTGTWTRARTCRNTRPPPPPPTSPT